MMRYAPYFLLGTFGALLLVVGIVALRGAPAVGEVPVPWDHPPVERDLPVIQRDTLRLLVLRDPLSWEGGLHGMGGLEYDLLERFSVTLGIPVLAIPMDHPDSMLMGLQRGTGDIIAAQMTPRSDRRRRVAHSRPYREVRPMLATLRPDPHVRVDRRRPVVTLPMDTVEMSLWSPFAAPGYRWERPGDRPVPLHLDPAITPEDLLMEVVLGRHAGAVVTDARARYEAGRFPVLEFSGPIGPPLPLCFVLRRNSPRLLGLLDAWLADAAHEPQRAAIIGRYAAPLPKPGPLGTKRPVPVHGGDSISPYDMFFRTHAAGLPWDWELLAAMAWKESRFDSTVTSRKGAQGIMQIMPRTAARLGLGPEDPMDDHIKAAVRYLNKLDTMWMRAIPDRERRLSFVLASYNAGPGHIIDAQRLAGTMGLDPGRWEHNVERAVLLLAKPRYHELPAMRNGYCNGRQVFHYVREVLWYYHQLQQRPGSVEGHVGDAGG